MFAFLSNFLQKKQIDTFGALPLDACRVTRPYLLERAGIEHGSVLMLAVPYLTPFADTSKRNLSCYAVSKDYHIFFSELFSELLPRLKEQYPEHRFAAFADHSPIDEIRAAASAGLGVIGENNLLLTSKYSSFVFLGEIITDAPLPYRLQEAERCEGCGACRRACPATNETGCLSALTQKRGTLKEDEILALRAHPVLWGCDVCQEVCPHTRRARLAGSIYSPIPFFSSDPIPYLTEKVLNDMTDADFQNRAFAWRGRDTIARNLNLKQKGEHECSN